jgi:hypothetical protein
VIVDHPICTSHSPGTVPQSIDHLLRTKRGWRISRFAAVGPLCVPR